MPATAPIRCLRACAVTAVILTLSACQSDRSPAPRPNSTALSTMERVALGANRCWFKSGDPAFASYRLAPELNSFSGRPRMLIVKRNAPEQRPLAVVQAEGQPARLQAFGPLFSEAIGARMATDIKRWAAGGQACV